MEYLVKYGKAGCYSRRYKTFRWKSGRTLSSLQLVKYHFSDISLVITFWLSPVRLLKRRDVDAFPLDLNVASLGLRLGLGAHGAQSISLLGPRGKHS